MITDARALTDLPIGGALHFQCKTEGSGFDGVELNWTRGDNFNID